MPAHSFIRIPVSASKIISLDAEDEKFLTEQQRIVLRNCGIINPEKIEDYINEGGYEAARIALTEKTPEEVIEEIKKTYGLEGRCSIQLSYKRVSFVMERETGFEPATYGLEGHRSSQLSYSRVDTL